MNLALPIRKSSPVFGYRYSLNRDKFNVLSMQVIANSNLSSYGAQFKITNNDIILASHKQYI